MRPPRRPAFVHAILVMGACLPLLACAANLTNIIAIRSLDRGALASEPVIALEGWVTGLGPGGAAFLQQGSLGIALAPMEGSPPFTQGSRILVEGVAEPDGPMARVRPTRATVLGTPGLPEPRKVSATQLRHPDSEFVRVAIEGVVLATSPVEGPRDAGKPDALVVLNTPGGIVGLQAQPRTPALAPSSLHGRNVRATGIALPVVDPLRRVIDVAVLVTPMDALGPIEGPPLPSEAPLLTIGEAMVARPASPTNVLRIQGIVTAMPAQKTLFVEDATAGMMVRSVYPIDARPGDRVDVEGMPRSDLILGDGTPNETPNDNVLTVFHATRLSVRQQVELPAPAVVASDDLDHAVLNFRRIEVKGLVLASARLGDPSHFRISLRCGSFMVDALGIQPDTQAPLPSPQSHVRVTGVLDQRAQADSRYQPLRLHVARHQDIVVVAPPPRDLTRALSWAAGTTTTLVLVAVAWALTLRRSVRLRTAELAAANASLAIANRARADFLAHMSHEVRTPVHAMNGLLQLLARQPSPGESQGILQRLSMAARSLTHLVNDALDLSKIDAGQLVLDPQPFHPNTLLDHLDGLFAPLAQDKGIAWSVDRLPTDTPTLVGDSFRLQQVLSNLATNAIKFTRHGHVHLRACLAPATPNDPNAPHTLALECEDTGSGIDPDVLRRLFQPYAQANASIPRTHGGTGLGLAISRRLVELMGGSIEAESQPGSGTRFRVVVSFPVQTGTSANAQPGPETLHATSAPPGRRLHDRRILVADDHPTNLGILEAAIEQENGCALLVPDGFAAVHAVESDPRGFDAVVMDLEMPVMDGLEAIRRIRALPGAPSIPILACSAGIRAAKRQAALAAGATEFLSKPFDLGDFVDALTRHLAPGPDKGTAPPPAARPQSQAAGFPRMDPATISLPEIEGIDSLGASRRFSATPSVFLHSLGRFKAEFASFAVALQQDVQHRRREEAARRLHGLAGAASMLGARQVAVAANDGAQRLRRDNPAGSMPSWETFLPLLKDLERLLGAIESHTARHEGLDQTESIPSGGN
jgi:signal transduction histidine kinase/CheY-like chemotaxis protein